MTITERIDAITAIPPDYRAETLPPPRSVKIELTGRCNFACAFCARSHKLRGQHDMDRSLYERLAIEMSEAGVEELGLFYLGESFLVPWLPEAVTFAKNRARFPYVFLTTNASLSNKSKVEAVMRAGLDSLKFSLNYADGQQFVEIAQVKEAIFGVMLQNIRDAWRVREGGGYSTRLYASYILYDGDQGDRMKRLVDELEPYLDEVYSLPLYNQGGYVTEEERARGWKAQGGNRGRAEALVPPLPCWAAFTEGHITQDGMLSACCFDHGGDFTMADLGEVSFLEGWNSTAFQELRRAHLAQDISATACRNCMVA